MEQIAKSIGVLCAIGYIIGLLTNFTTTSHTKKAIRLVCVLYIISAVLAPLTGGNLNLSYKASTDNTVVSSDTDEYIISMAENKMEEIIHQRLIEKNISYTRLSVHINKQTEGLITDEITLHGIPETEKHKVRILLNDIITEDKIKFGE